MKLIKAKVELPILELDQDAIGFRDGLVAHSRTLGQVVDGETAKAVGTIGSQLQSAIRDTEKLEAELRDPVNKWLKLLRSFRDDYIAPLVAEKDRHARSYAAFQAEEQARIRHEEELRQAAIRKADEEAAQARRAAEDAARKMNDEAELAKALEAEQRANEAKAAVRAAIVSTPAPAQKASGARATMKVRWEITDEAALFNVMPQWFRLEPRRNIINDSVSKDTKLPGLKVWEEAVGSFVSQ
jgi:hypothetical protein